MHFTLTTYTSGPPHRVRWGLRWSARLAADGSNGSSSISDAVHKEVKGGGSDGTDAGGQEGEAL